MADLTNNVEDEKPLDPAAERLRKKMLRLMVISLGSMFIGIFAVLFAIVYKMNNAAVETRMIEAVVELPAGFQVEESRLGDGTLILRGIAVNGDKELLLFDAATGQSSGKITIK